MKWLTLVSQYVITYFSFNTKATIYHINGHSIILKIVIICHFRIICLQCHNIIIWEDFRVTDYINNIAGGTVVHVRTLIPIQCQVCWINVTEVYTEIRGRYWTYTS